MNWTTPHELSRLNDDERALFGDLRTHRIADRLRLEQERVDYRWVCHRVSALES